MRPEWTVPGSTDKEFKEVGFGLLFDKGVGSFSVIAEQ